MHSLQTPIKNINLEVSKMVVKIIGLIIGILIAVFGGYYFSKEKDDAESRRIYGIVIAVGVVVAVACIVFLS